jgi:hypothetical protein
MSRVRLDLLGAIAAMAWMSPTPMLPIEAVATPSDEVASPGRDGGRTHDVRGRALVGAEVAVGGA